MDQAAAYRAAVAHRPIRDSTCHGGQCAMRHIGNTLVLDVCMRNAGTQDNAVVLLFHPLEFRYMGNVHQQVGLHQSQVQHGPQRLAACQHLHGNVFSLNEPDCRFWIGGTLVLEQRRLLPIPSPASCVSSWPTASSWATLNPGISPCASRALKMASSTRCGVAGDVYKAAPRGCKASLIALRMVAGGAMAPLSPMPLTPNSVYGDKVSI